jgi:hypothetical protein
MGNSMYPENYNELDIEVASLKLQLNFADESACRLQAQVSHHIRQLSEQFILLTEAAEALKDTTRYHGAEHKKRVFELINKIEKLKI